MTKQVLKSITTGLFIGATLFFMPLFILQLVAFFIIIASLFKVMAWRMFRSVTSQWQRRLFADNISNNLNEQYAGFHRNFANRNASGEKKTIIIN